MQEENLKKIVVGVGLWYTIFVGMFIFISIVFNSIIQKISFIQTFQYQIITVMVIIVILTIYLKKVHSEKPLNLLNHKIIRCTTGLTIILEATFRVAIYIPWIPDNIRLLLQDIPNANYSSVYLQLMQVSVMFLQIILGIYLVKSHKQCRYEG